MHVVNILFLGAGKRFTLLERFIDAARNESLGLNLFSVEDSYQVPIIKLSKILLAPRFKDSEFESYLEEIVQNHHIDLVIPNMDAATVVLSRMKGRLAAIDCHAVVSAASLCAVMEDKIMSEQWFTMHGFPVPPNQGFPCIAKHRLGFGSRDQIIVHQQSELDSFLSGKQPGSYILQKYVSGPEYTVDAYVGRNGRMHASLSRRRLKVSDGEVEVSQIETHHEILELTASILSVGEWEGPITLQFINSGDGPVIIEVNPRFGGGVTHAIQAGLDMPRWILREYLGRPITRPVTLVEGSIMTRYRNDIFL